MGRKQIKAIQTHKIQT